MRRGRARWRLTFVLEEVGDRFELSRVDLAANQQNSPDYLRINPKARVPALTDGDWTLTEAPAILRYIAARHPAAGLWPWDPREEARCAEWLNWLSSTIHVAFVHVRRASRYASDPRAVEDVAATAKKTCRDLWHAVDEKIGEGPGPSVIATASPIRFLLFTGRGDADRLLASTWRTIFRAGRRTRGGCPPAPQCKGPSPRKVSRCRHRTNRAQR